MDRLNALLQTSLIVFGEVDITVGKILSVVVVILGGILFVSWSARFLRNRLQAHGSNPNVVQLVSRAWLILGLIVVAFSTLEMLSVPLTAFAFISGAVAIGVGFGAQNIINNFISGWILMWERPIKIGDFLELNEARGTVEAINTRSTRIRRVDGVHMLIPNSQLLETTVVNWTLMDNLVRTAVRVGVAYGSDVRKVEALLYEAAREHPDILEKPAPLVVFDDFGDSSLVFELNVWVEALAERGLRMIRSDLRFRVDALFSEQGIVIAFPQRDLHLDGELRITQPAAG